MAAPADAADTGAIARLREQGVEIVAGSITDLAGVTRAKYVPVQRLTAFERSGMGASPSWSVFCADTGIASVPGIGVVGDLRIRIAGDDVRVIADGVGWAPGGLFDQSGPPSPLCTRASLARVEAALAERGLSARVGAEIECTLLSDGGRASDETWTPYGLRTSLDRSGFLLDVVRDAERTGLGIQQLHTEYGHDQFEVSLAPDSPVAAADAVVLARIVLSRAARRHGMTISFAPVAFADDAGNGAHVHVSLADAEGPLLAGGDGPHGIRSAGGAAIGGILAALPDLIGLYAGSVLSALRLKPGNWAGGSACWGLENREAAVRFIAGTPANPHGANVELKIIDGTANPYLAIGAMLGSALRGIDLGFELPPEVTGNPVTSGATPLPTDLGDILDAFESSAVSAELLSAPIVRGVAAVRRYELYNYGDRPAAEVVEALRLAWTC